MIWNQRENVNAKSRQRSCQAAIIEGFKESVTDAKEVGWGTQGITFRHRHLNDDNASKHPTSHFLNFGNIMETRHFPGPPRGRVWICISPANNAIKTDENPIQAMKAKPANTQADRGEELRSNREFQQCLIESSRDCIKVLDLEGRLVSMNAGGVEILEICDLPSVLGSNWVDFWEGPDREAARRAVETARTGGVGRFIGIFTTLQTHQRKHWDVVVSSIKDKQGKTEKLLAVSRDITEWKRAEELLRAITDGTAAMTGQDFFCSLVKHLGKALQVRFAFVAECLPKKRARSLAFWIDNNFGANFEYDLPGTPCMEVSEGRTCHFPDRVPELFPLDKGMIDLGTVSYLGVPLFDKNRRVIGHAVVFDDKPMPTDSLALSVMEAFAARAGAELERKRAEDRERTILEVNNAIISNLTQDALLHSTSEALKRILPFDRAALTLYDPEADVLRILALEGRIDSAHFKAGTPIGRKDSHVGWAFDNQRTHLRVDLEKDREYPVENRLYEEGVRSLCTAPLVVAGQSIGTLTIGSLAPNQYSQSDAAFLQEISNQIALAVSNMRAFEEIAGLKARLQAENLYLQEEIRTEHNFDEIVGNSPALLHVLSQLDQIAPTDSTVLVFGETGTGKELIARAIHDRSPRKDRPLVKVNCGAISAGLVESELFGHVRGAFTGALSNRDGRFKLADGGTIFLDEVGELPLETQVKLLRVLQEQEFEPVGASATVRVDVRIIAATNRDLEVLVAERKFRSDLFYRLNVLPLHIPALRERKADIPLLITFFIQKFARKFARPVKVVPQDTMRRLANYSWPGNIRELQNVIERAVVLSQGDILVLATDIAPATTKATTSPIPIPIGRALPLADVPVPPTVTRDAPGAGSPLEEVERRHIETTLMQTNWMIEGERGAAKLLDLNPSTLRSRMQKLGIRRPSKAA
jgi:formate hydrogenlyase transcriptional activator